MSQYNISNQFLMRDIKFVYNMLNCRNAIIRKCIPNASDNSNSLIGYKLAYFRSVFSIYIYILIVILCPILRSPNLMLVLITLFI